MSTCQADLITLGQEPGEYSLTRYTCIVASSFHHIDVYQHNDKHKLFKGLLRSMRVFEWVVESHCAFKTLYRVCHFHHVHVQIITL